ncbi:MAG: class I SAM-dependent methyltransferase [Melioribacter sp.]|nr:class I SAM-dependent methyltransferase [Melioribacter sp.]
MRITDEQIIENLVSQSSESDYNYSHVEVGITFNNITSKELFKEFSTSRIYKCIINGREYINKVIYKNPNMDLKYVLKSYQNYRTLMSKEGLVDVYDFRISDCGEKFEVLMEDLSKYYDVENAEENYRSQLATQILSIIKNITKQNIIPVDCGIVNFVTDGNNVKMLDLDFLLKWNEVTYFNIKWFLSRLEGIKTWCPSISSGIDELASDVNTQKINFFGLMPYNPIAAKLIEEGERLLIEENNSDEALNKFYKALEFQPSCAAAYNNLAALSWNNDENLKTLSLMECAFELEPDNEIYKANYYDVVRSLDNESKRGNFYLTNSLSILPAKEKSENYITLQKEIDNYSYPSNYAYDIITLKPKGSLETRVEYFVKYTPELFDRCNNFLSIGSSLGYMLLFHSFRAEKCTGIEPDSKANEIVRSVTSLRNASNIELFTGTFKDFEKKEKYDLIWMGNVFQYMYVDYSWKVAEELAKISSGKCIIEAPFEGDFLKQQSNLNANWKNEQLMNDYSFKRFTTEMEKYFKVISANPSGTDPLNRMLVVLERK